MSIICPLMYEARDVERMMVARATPGPLEDDEKIRVAGGNARHGFLQHCQV
jgi:hypothetical protein